tara:strand:- start:259 stop:1290 length:1032 start_codon:yes stop_codon:yes gene_type:complete
VGRDLIAISNTGSGKTAAYSLPLLDYLKKNKIKAKPGRMRGLVLVPTRELALQVFESLKKYGKGLAFKVGCFFGGVGMASQVKLMGKGLDIIVSTPGRLINIEKEGHALFDQCEFIVVDEFDKMLDLDFQKDIEKLWGQLPTKKQSAFFSATNLDKLDQLAKNYLTDPLKITVQDEDVSEGEDKAEKGPLGPNHDVYFVNEPSKKGLLKKVLRRRSVKKAIVFVKTKKEADEVLKDLQKAFIKSDSLHGDKDQVERMKVLGQFKRNKFKVLVATDLASRGLHIGGLDLIVNYHLPKDPRDYKHRVGRLCREGQEGTSINFCQFNDKKLLSTLEQEFKRPFTLN